MGLRQLGFVRKAVFSENRIAVKLIGVEIWN
jgi:hypothetical protein